MSWRSEIYRNFQKKVIEPFVLPAFFSEGRASSFGKSGLFEGESPLPLPNDVKRIWFHASSVGELEILWNVIETFGQGGHEMIVTVFSESAEARIEKLRSMLAKTSGRILFIGYSPWEGSWKKILKKFAPSAFVTARYEAWPELWMSLGELKIPLVIVSAQSRRSLKLAKKVCQLSGCELPKMSFLTVQDSEHADLQRDFPKAEINTTGEARWDRVYARSQIGSSRAQELKLEFADRPKPWGILGQVWPEDLELWKKHLAKIEGTLWIFPHQIDEKNVGELGSQLAQAGVQWIRTSRNKESQKDGGNCILVDEAGFLLEAYSSADWAYIGGGFGQGVHSTIEPAIYGIPISCGSKNAELFSEIGELRDCDQLRLLRNEYDLEMWLACLKNASLRKEEWRELALKRRGATKKISDAILRLC